MQDAGCRINLHLVSCINIKEETNMINEYCRHCKKETDWNFNDGWWQCSVCGYGVPFGCLLMYERFIKP